MAEVQLAIYDLSHGMARSLSAQFLGPQHTIDMVPHTGIVVFGKEWYFGGGVQSQPPHVFRATTGMHPCQTIILGETNISLAEFEAWVTRMNQSQYSIHSYDLLTRNCNHFSFDASKFLGFADQFPQWILQVPQIFLSSPMGQMVRPMLENMQLSNAGIPFADVPPTMTTKTTAHSTVATPSANPWANIPPADTFKTTIDVKPKAASTTSTSSGTPVLDSFTKPLLSTDTKTVELCVEKVSNEATQEIWDAATPILSSKDQSLSDELSERVFCALHDALSSSNHAPTFALMLLRNVVLRASVSVPSRQQCVDWLQQSLHNTDMSVNLRSMVFLTASNVVSKLQQMDAFCETLVETGITYLHDTAPSIRQAVCASLYNVSLLIGTTTNSKDSELSDTAVSLLCAVFEGIDNETDEMTLQRRLAIVGRLLRPVTGPSRAAENLVRDLGFGETLSTIQTNQKSEKLAAELANILNQ